MTSGFATYAISMGTTTPLVFKSGASSGLSAGDVLGQDIVLAGVSNSSAPISYVNVNGRLVTQVALKGASNDGGPFMLGDDTASNDRHGSFIMGELILVGGELAPETVENFEGYLAHKWGLALDSAHTYAIEFNAVVFD